MRRESTLRTKHWTAVAAALALTLAACGGDDDATGEPIDSAPGTTVSDGSSMRAPTPVEVVGGASGAAGALATMDAEASDMRFAPGVFEYVVGEGMPDLPTNDVGYVYDVATEVSAEQAAEVAAALGVEGEPVLVDQGFATSWQIGPDDGTAPSVWVNDDAQLTWYYNAPWAEGSTVTVSPPCVLTTNPDGSSVETCEEPEPPQNVPTGDEAEQRVREILTALGLDVDSMTFETYADDWFASVQATTKLGDVTDGRSWGFGFGGEGVMQYASGSLAEPEPVGPYPLIDLDTAIARLQDGGYGGYGGFPGVATDIAVASTGEVVGAEDRAAEETPAESVAPAEPTPTSVPPTEPDPVPVTSLPTDTLPVDTIPVGTTPPETVPVDAGEPVVITLVDVQADVWWAWDADGSAWLLPAYRFIDSNGGWHVVPAVTDEFLIIVEPTDLPVPEPMPIETAPVEPPAGEEPIDIRPGTDPEVARSMFEEYVGLSLDEFTATAKDLGFAVRVTVQDGEALAVTADYSDTRVNVAVEGSTVVAIESIG